MKKMALLVVSFALSTAAFGGEPRKLSDEGIYAMVNPDSGGMTYQVDTVAQLCFITSPERKAFAPIPCENLAKRPEWKTIITWVK